MGGWRLCRRGLPAAEVPGREEALTGVPRRGGTLLASVQLATCSYPTSVLPNSAA